MHIKRAMIVKIAAPTALPLDELEHIETSRDATPYKSSYLSLLTIKEPNFRSSSPSPQQISKKLGMIKQAIVRYPYTRYTSCRNSLIERNGKMV